MGLGKWVSSFWKKESTKVIFNAAVSILKVLAFGVGERLWSVTQAEVARVAPMNISGQEKAKIVWRNLELEFKELPGYIGNLAIELAVAHFKESQVQK